MTTPQQFELQGDYFNGKFNVQVEADRKLSRKCPANTDHMLWDANVYHAHVDQVVESVKQGHKTWRNLSPDERLNYLKKFQEVAVKRKDEIALRIALETGKPLWEAHTEAAAISAKVDVTINESLKRIATTEYENILPDTDGQVYYRPLGPCLIIGPFNFPCHLANGQILSALAAGNAVIFKPSEKTIASGQILIECFHEAGFPEGVVNLINGGGETVSKLLKHKDIKGVFFTGSKEVGQIILKKTHTDLSKLVALELGGKNASIVHNDASMDHTLVELLKASFLTTGQRCTSTSKIIIHKSLQAQFIERFHELAKRIIIDHPTDFETEPFMGPLVDEKSADDYLLYMGMAKREGAEEIMRGKLLEKKYPGHYVSPSIHFMEKPDPKGMFFMSEIFGPNCTILPYEEIEEAIDIANMSEYGLAAAVFTKDKAIYQKCLNEMEAGLININRSTIGASSKLPFGGIKSSGNHRPAAVSMIDSCAYPVASLELKVNDGVPVMPTGLSEV